VTNLVARGVSENQRAEVRLTEYSRQITSGDDKPGQGYPCVAFQPRYYTRDNKTGGAPNETVDITNAHKAGDSAPVMAFESRFARNDRGAPSDIASPLKAESGRTGKGDGATMAAGPFGVRRLTPTECERLQGIPDGWTDVNGMSDSARYRMLGNAVARVCAEWLGQRIMEVEAR